MVMKAGSELPLRAQVALTAFDERELDELERRQPAGMTSAEIIGLVQERGLKLSEGTFRKYVQLGLLPRSRRVGKKGKHRGSTGIYPTSTVRLIVAIKRMMAEGLTIEQIQQTWLKYRGRIDTIHTDLKLVIGDMQQEIVAPRFDASRRQELGEELRQARGDALDLIQRLYRLERDVAWSPAETVEKDPDDETDTDPHRFF